MGVFLLLGGCAGVYAEVAVSKMTSASVSPSGGGADIDVGGASTVGFNLGLDFGSTRQRFAIGYARDSVSYDNGSGTLGNSAMRYDFNIVNLAERLKLRIGLGAGIGTGTSTYAGMSKDGNGGNAIAGLDLTYFLTWTNAVHVFAGAEALFQSVDGGSMSGTGASLRLTISHSFSDARPDKSFVVPLETNKDITGLIEAGASQIGCATAEHTRVSFAAQLDVVCPGKRHVEYFQIAEGMLVTCKHEQSMASCRSLSQKIVSAAAGELHKAADPAPAPAPAPAPTPAPDPAPADAP